jgi:hypothetical protein
MVAVLAAWGWWRGPLTHWSRRRHACRSEIRWLLCGGLHLGKRMQNQLNLALPLTKTLTLW